MRELIARGEIDIELGVGGVADLRGGIGSGERSELRGGGEDEGLVAGFVVAGRIGSGAGLGDDLHGAVEEFDDIGNVEVVLIESGEEEDFVFLERTADGASALLLAAVGLEGHKGIGGAESAVADVIEAGAVPVIGAGFGDDVDDGAAGASQFGAVGIGGDAELLHDFVGELIRRAIEAAGLGEEGVVEVAAIDEEAVLESAKATEGEIAVGGGSEAARILRDAGREQHQIGEAAAVEREIGDGTFVDERGDGAGLGVDELRRAGDGDAFLRAGDGEVKFEFGGGADVDMKRRGDLRRHALSDGAGGVVAGRQEIEREAAFGVGCGGVADAGGGVDGDDGGLGDVGSGGIENGAVNGAGGGILGDGGAVVRNRERVRMQGDQERRTRHGSPTCDRDEARRRESRADSGGERGRETRFFCSTRGSVVAVTERGSFWGRVQEWESGVVEVP